MKHFFNFWVLFYLLFCFFPLKTSYAANPSGNLRLEFITSYNLIIDSNVESPSTYAPRSAYLGVKICNDGNTDMSEVTINFGDFDANTPGIYPSRTVVESLYSGTFSLTHHGCGDYTRFIDTVRAGECMTQYWLIEYPNLDANGNSVAGAAPKPEDDLWLEYDVWASANEGGTLLEANDTRRVYMRNEISAMANKIWPNGDNKVPDEYVAAMEAELGWRPLNTGPVGSVIAVEGIWFDLGNVRFGFDNNGDYVPDYNAYMNPVGDPYTYDACCFRLVKTYGLVIVKKTDGTEALYPFEDQMYFEDLPSKNNGAVGLTFYEFAAIDGPCAASLTPYQEVASGYDNEKFNGDFGTYTGGLASEEPPVVLDKNVDLAVVDAGNALQYTLTFTNNGETEFGLPLYSLPVTVQDEIPEGVVYVAGSAESNNSIPASTNLQVLYSTDNGTTWTTTEPSPASDVTNLQWILDKPIASYGASMTVTFSVEVPIDYPSAVIDNTGGVSLGSGDPFLTDDAVTILTGENTIGDLVWLDNGDGGGTIANGIQDGTEAGIAAVDVSLYFDVNGNGILDDSDMLMGVETTDASGYYLFDSLPDGTYFAMVDVGDVPSGNTSTTPTSFTPFVQSSDYLTADFGFAPALQLTKTLVSETPAYEDHYVTYEIDVENLLPAPPGAGNPYAEPIWVNNTTYQGSNILNGNNALGEIDGVYSAITNWPKDNNGIPPETQFITEFNNLSFANCETLSSVTAEVYFELTGDLIDDDVAVVISDNTGILQTDIIPVATLNADFSPAIAPYTIDISPYFSSFTELSNLSIGLYTEAVGSGGSAWDGVDLLIDGIGVRVEKEGACASYIKSDCDYIPYVIENATAWNSPPDDGTIVTSLPFDFQFGGTYYTTGTILTLTSNGQMCFTPPSGNGYPLENLPSTSYENCVHIWADLNPATSPGSITYGTSGTAPERLFIVDFTDIYYFNTTTPLSLQIVLHEATGEVQIMVNDIDESLPHTLGITHGSTILLEYNNQAPGGTVSNVCYSYQWITENSGFDPTTTLSPVPLTDNFDPCYLEFLEASIPPDNIDAANGLLSWNDVGHINAGMTQTVAVTFIAKDPTACASPNPTDNIAATTDVSFANGNPANSDTDNAIVQVEATGSLGDFVWNDMNGDGVQDVNEAGIEGVTLTLTSSVDLWIEGILYTAGSPITTTTDENGFYEFNGLLDADYTITVDVTTIPGTVTNTFDPNGGGDNTATATISGANDDTTIDFGYDVNNALTGNIWEDVNGDAGLNDGEADLTNVTVELYGPNCSPCTTTTDAEGFYEFTDLADGDYNVVVLNNTGDLSTGTWNNTYDPDANLDSESGTISLNGGIISSGNDFGYQEIGTNTLDGTVYFDVNGDATQQAGTDEGQIGVNVSLYKDENCDGIIDAEDALYATTTTDSNGDYAFANLPNACFIVVVEDAAYFPTQDPDETNVCITCDNTGSVDLTAGSSVSDVDFGYQPTGNVQIGDTVWYDSNGDGLEGGTEIGIPNIDILLYADFNNDGIYAPIDTATTDANGNYLFDVLPNGNYQIILDSNDSDIPTDGAANPYQLTTTDTMNLEIVDYAVLSINGTSCLTDCSLDADFGLAPLGAIGDFLFWDDNNNGTQDWTEAGIPNVDVYLYEDTDNDGIADVIVDTLTTSDGTVDVNGDGVIDPIGFYQFTNLPPSNYIVVVENTDPDLLGASQTADPNSDGLTCEQVADPDPNINLGYSLCDNKTAVTVNYGTIFTGADFGYQSPGVIGDYVWFDADQDGEQDAGEPGFNDVTVNLVSDCGAGTCSDGDEIIVATTATDPDGYYTFSQIPDGTYTVVLPEPPTNYTITSDIDGGLNQSVSSTETTVVLSGGVVTDIDGNACTDCDLNIDFGFELNGQYGVDGNICMDDMTVGTQGTCGDPEDTQLADIIVYLYNDAGDYLGSTTTDATGGYSFGNLPEDNYIVAIGTDTSPLDLAVLTTQDSDTPADSIKTSPVSAFQFFTLNSTTTTNDVLSNVDFAFDEIFELDFGDVPDSYNTLLTVDGARHVVSAVPNLYLGSIVETETDGSPATNADGDGAEEDGITFVDVENWTVGTAATGNGGEISVEVVGEGYLTAWMDFDGDGSFANDMVINVPVTTGSYNFTFDIPLTDTLTPNQEVYTRFRLFSSEQAFAGFAYTGLPAGSTETELMGEVEDYLVRLAVSGCVPTKCSPITITKN